MNDTAQKKSYKQHLKAFLERFKRLQGEPRYIAMGMAIGVFVSVTPTIPFHTIIAVALAFVLKGSKPAAAIGVWFSNPVTIPLFYIGSFRVGTFFLNKSIPFNTKFESITELMTLGLDVTIAMIAGGAILGIVPAIIAYFVTYKFFKAIREKVRRRKLLKQ